MWTYVPFYRYDNSDIYTYVGSILVSVNPYRMFNPLYGLDAVSKYDGQIIGTLPPHLFAVGASAYHRMLAKDGEKQVRIPLEGTINGTPVIFPN